MAGRSTNPFIRQVYFWWLIAPILTSIILPAVMPAGSFKVQSEEQAFLVECGRDVGAVTQTATSVFTSWFINTGFVDDTMDPSRHAMNSQRTGYAWMGGIFHGWFQRFWLFVYRIVWRWVAFWELYVVCILGIAGPCLVDGLIVRAKKRYRFGQYNPLAFNVSGTLFALAVGWMFYVPMLPLPLTALFMGGFFCVFALFAWFTSANFQRGA